jgi:hypothetical protein
LGTVVSPEYGLISVMAAGSVVAVEFVVFCVSSAGALLVLSQETITIPAMASPTAQSVVFFIAQLLFG